MESDPEGPPRMRWASLLDQGTGRPRMEERTYNRAVKWWSHQLPTPHLWSEAVISTACAMKKRQAQGRALSQWRFVPPS